MRPTVAQAMITAPKTLLATASVEDVRAFFTDPHVHAALLVDAQTLVSVIGRADLCASLDPTSPARHLGQLDERCVHADADLEEVRDRMRSVAVRRLAVLDELGRLQGLLCLKRTGHGFCTDQNVRERLEVRTRR